MNDEAMVGEGREEGNGGCGWVRKEGGVFIGCLCVI